MLFGASLSYELELVTLRLCRTPLFVDNTNMVWIPSLAEIQRLERGCFDRCQAIWELSSYVSLAVPWCSSQRPDVLSRPFYLVVLDGLRDKCCIYVQRWWVQALEILGLDVLVAQRSEQECLQ